MGRAPGGADHRERAAPGNPGLPAASPDRSGPERRGCRPFRCGAARRLRVLPPHLRPEPAQHEPFGRQGEAPERLPAHPARCRPGQRAQEGRRHAGDRLGRLRQHRSDRIPPGAGQALIRSISAGPRIATGSSGSFISSRTRASTGGGAVAASRVSRMVSAGPGLTCPAPRAPTEKSLSRSQPGPAAPGKPPARAIASKAKSASRTGCRRTDPAPAVTVRAARSTVATPPARAKAM